jgi:hypothetical protein
MCDFWRQILSFELEFSELLLIAFLFKAILRKKPKEPLDKLLFQNVAPQ